MTRNQQLGLAMGISVLVHGALLTAFPLHLRQGKSEGQALVTLDLELEQPAATVAGAARQELATVPTDNRLLHDIRRPSAGLATASPTPDREAAPLRPPARETSTAPAFVDDLRLRSLQMIRSEVTDPFAGQRVLKLPARTRDEVFGPYEEAYRQKVEQVGTVNYPPPVAGRRLYGVVRLTATIRQDGSLAMVEIMQSSGSPDLDDAARRIVQMAAPFQPFTPAMRAGTDLVSITRSFNFVRAGEAIRSQ